MFADVSMERQMHNGLTFKVTQYAHVSAADGEVIVVMAMN